MKLAQWCCYWWAMQWELWLIQEWLFKKQAVIYHVCKLDHDAGNTALWLIEKHSVQNARSSVVNWLSLYRRTDGSNWNKQPRGEDPGYLRSRLWGRAAWKGAGEVRIHCTFAIWFKNLDFWDDCSETLLEQNGFFSRPYDLFPFWLSVRLNLIRSTII